jgi:excinuclease ABC subunit C
MAAHRLPSRARGVPGRYFGPYPSAARCARRMNLMHKLFRLRSCEDSVFRNRSRPCLQHQIGRCSAPCVGLVSRPPNYAEACAAPVLFLDGRSGELIDELVRAMEAGECRSRIRTGGAPARPLPPAQLQAKQYVTGNADLDVLACVVQGQACVLLLFFRDGRNLGTPLRSCVPEDQRRGQRRRGAGSLRIAVLRRAAGAAPRSSETATSPTRTDRTCAVRTRRAQGRILKPCAANA